ncbi:outer membrane protein [Sediminimonas qiaohouensis]|uniref:outer membrane protein n=1 Tax=Sediminimonas qiaohouensis TaxID=552061 RepID=UPI0004161A92|nr:outer membrane beta-barrel protein [Sediminimonas qiaohouensis]
MNFDLSAKKTGFGALAVGYDWQNGFRGDVSLSVSGSANVAGPCSSASNGSPCDDHADITDASISTAAVMGNVFYSPLEQAGNDSRFQPFLVAGLGLARNKVGEWTRFNANATTQTRTYQGNSSVDLAWSVGAGAAYQLTRPGEWPVMLEASWRYYDYGTAEGGAQPIGTGSQPTKPLTFDNTAHVIAIGIRVPLQRY